MFEFIARLNEHFGYIPLATRAYMLMAVWHQLSHEDAMLCILEQQEGEITHV